MQSSGERETVDLGVEQRMNALFDRSRQLYIRFRMFKSALFNSLLDGDHLVTQVVNQYLKALTDHPHTFIFTRR